MLVTIIITSLLITIKIFPTDGIKTTPPVSIILDGLTLQTWNEQSLWNKTRSSIAQHLNEFCKKDYQCDAEYGIHNIHLLNAAQYGSSSIRLNITADEPVSSSNMRSGNIPSSYNYTALLLGALSQTKIDTERLHENRGSYSTPDSHQNSVHKTSRLLFVLLGITLVAVIFGLTVFFFQRIRRHNYSKLLKPSRTSQQTNEDLLTNAPSTAPLHQ